MDAQTFENLDLACAKTGKAIAEMPSKELENLVTNALAVLEQQGIYALFLFLKTKDSSGGKNVKEKIYEFLKERLLFDNIEDVFALLQQMANDLDTLLLARDLVRQILVYARYHARLLQKSEV